MGNAMSQAALMKQLRDYAATCRERNPLPDEATLSTSDRAKLDLYKQLIENTKSVQSRRRINVCVTDELGILAAQSLWPSEHPLAVLLTGDEWRAYDQTPLNPNDRYDRPRHVELHWRVRTAVEQRRWWRWRYYTPDAIGIPWDSSQKLVRFKARKDLELWLVEYGSWHGPLASSNTIDLWEWDGQKACFRENWVIVDS